MERTFDESLISRLVVHAQSSPDSHVLITLDNGEHIHRTVTYRQLLENVRKVAAFLTGHRLRDKRVLLLYLEVPDFLESFLACMYIGAIPVPLPFGRGGKQLSRLRNIANDARASALLTTRKSIPQMEKSGLNEGGELHILATDDAALLTATDTEGSFQPGPTAFIQYTSGSTGNPKGVIVSANNLMHNQEMIRQAFFCDPGSIILSWLPFHHDMGLIGNLLHTVYIGCSCIVMSPFHFIQKPQRWVEAISRFSVTHSGGPNFSFDLCAEKTPVELVDDLDLSSWKVAFNGSEPVRYDTMRRFSDFFQPSGFHQNTFYPCYGMAEATLFVTGKKDPGADNMVRMDDSTGQWLVSSGKPVQGVGITILSTTDQRPCRDGEKGEICLEGDSVFEGYFDKDNSALFYDNGGRRLFRTGDLGFIYGDELFVNGRIKEMLIIRGQNFFPTDIERMITASHPALENNGAAIFGMSGPDRDFVIVAELKREYCRNPDTREIISRIDQTVRGSFGIAPIDIILTTPLGIPRTTSGKLQRIRCRDHYRDNTFSVVGRSGGLTDFKDEVNSGQMITEILRNPQYDSIKRYLLDIITQRTGGLPTNLMNDGIELTELGLDSLRGMELINAINKQLHVSLEVSAVLRDNTLHGLITLLENILWLKTGTHSGKEIVI
jgi:acyl-CoA synthetase (AMP-forming)/AMP-acid ligase II